MNNKDSEPDKYLDYLKKNSSQQVNKYASKLYEELIRTYPPLKLFQIERVTISGLYPFKSDEIIEMNSKSGCNVIYGGNGAGKTSSLLAFEFGLLGSKTIEISKTFGKRIINKFVVEIFLRIENTLYSLKRWMTTAEAHNVSFTRINENDPLSQQYPSVEGYRETANEFHKLTGLNLNDVAVLHDFFTMRVPRNHYLSSTIKGNNGAYVRELLLSKLIDPGNSLPSIIVQQSKKLLQENKTKYNRIKRRIDLIESLAEDKVEQDDNLKDMRESIEIDLIELTKKIDNRRNEREAFLNEIGNQSNQKDKDLTKFQDKTNSDELYELQLELVELEQNNARLERLKDETWICDTCDSQIEEDVARSRLAENLCPICGQWAELAVSFQEYQVNRRKIQTIKNRLDEIQKQVESPRKSLNIAEKSDVPELEETLNNVRLLDREIQNLEEELRQVTRDHSAINPLRSDETLLDLKQQSNQTHSEIELFSELLEKSRNYLDQVTTDFIEEVNSRFSILQREIFDNSKWLLTPNYDIIADDAQNFTDLSFGEKNLLELAFRLAVIEVLHSKGIPMFFSIDTPEESLDIAYNSRIAKILENFAKKISNSKHKFFVVATSSKEFTDNLDTKVFRVENLLNKSLNTKPFQVKQLALTKFIS
ncbi:MAG: hypothetical protein ACW981_10010 [Candidatus Hodarchaeales archaeon]|jgi:DNA repair exonuclease SbcCD ATPase subunit